MTHVITQNCCNDAGCVSVCPVNCIHPTPGEPEFATTEILYIDPAVCIDCGACFDACPVGAIYPDYELPEVYADYLQLNEAYYVDPRRASYDQSPVKQVARPWAGHETGEDPLTVAVVGGGPAGFYAAQELLGQRGLQVHVDMFEKLPVPGGLARYGVAPDHQGTKAVLDGFTRTTRHDDFRLFGNVEVGRDVSHDDLAQRYHAVIYAVGAMDEKPLGITGETLENSSSAAAFVGWYNGHPEFAHRKFDLGSERAVIVGNGNVAIDIARILSSSPEALGRTDVSDVALDALAHSRIREVVIVGRRGPAEAAFTTPELMGLTQLTGVDIVVSKDELSASWSCSQGDVPIDPIDEYKRRLLEEIANRPRTSDRSISFRFLRTPSEILGDRSVSGVRLARNELVQVGHRFEAQPTGDSEIIDCGLVLRAVGFRGHAVPGLPFDSLRSVIPSQGGRVVDPETREVVVGTYVTGWIKRGPSGVIGTNKQCAKDTVAALLEDFADGALAAPQNMDDVTPQLLGAVDYRGWRAIDSHERTTGRGSGRPRIKLLDVKRMLEVAAEEH